MRKSILIVTVLILLGISYSNTALGHISPSTGHLGSYLFREPNVGKADPTGITFTWGSPSEAVNHFVSTSHFPWPSINGSPLRYGSHDEWRVPYVQKGTANCDTCARDHIRFYYENGRYDPNHGYYTPAHIHHDLSACGRHIGAYFDERRWMVRDDYAAHGHNQYSSLWNNTDQVWDSCNSVWRGGNGYVSYVDNQIR